MPRTPAWKEAKRRLSAPERARGGRPTLARTLRPEATLLDIADNLLVKGVMIDGELILALADVDLIYLRVAVLLSAADRVLGPHRPRRR